jgi:hypothetical protein
VDCEGFDLTYTRIASDKSSSLGNIPSVLENDVDKKVDGAIEAFLRSLSQIGPELMSVRRRLEFLKNCPVAKNIFVPHITILSHASRIGFNNVELF